ncbi:MAG: hypothetical protein ACUZ8H_05465 [Candidatus Anammoxibacter sp.]
MRKILLLFALFLTVSLPAAAMFTYPVTNFQSASALDGTETLDTIGLTVTVLFDMDATLSASTGTAHRFKNAITANTEYDAYLGDFNDSDGAQPNLTGSGAAQYYAHDGGDYFTVIDDTGTVMEDWHKTSGGAGVVWQCTAYQQDEINHSGALWGNFAGSGSDFGSRLLNKTVEDIRFLIGKASGADFYNSDITPVDTFTIDDILFCLTWNAAGSTNIVWYNTSTGSAFTDTYSAPSSVTEIATNTWAWFAAMTPTVSSIMPAGTRSYGIYGGTGALTNADMAKIKTHLELRHGGRSYAFNDIPEEKQWYAANDNLAIKPTILRMAA